MLVKLIGNKKIIKLNLPENIEGNYWVCDNVGNEEQKLVNIKSLNDRWVVTSNTYSKIINEKYIKKSSDGFSIISSNETVIKEIGLEYYKRVILSLKNKDNIYALYYFPTYEKDIKTYKLVNSNEITIGSGVENDIIYTDNLVNETHARIFYRNGKYYLENYDTIFGTFLNDKFVEEENITVIENGDIITICGIKLMILDNKINIIGNIKDIRVTTNNLNVDRMTYQQVENLKLEEEIDDGVELYTESDYFYSSPRIMDKIKEEKVSIDEPPAKENKNGAMQYLALLSSVGISVITAVNLVAAVNNFGSASNKNTATIRIITTVLMLITALGIPLIRILLKKRNSKKLEKKRQYEYRKYINSKIIKINEIIDNQTKVLKNNNLQAEQCERVVLEKSHELWERNIEDEDFLTVNLGSGEKELDLGFSKADKKFSVEQDNLLDIYYNVVNSSRAMNGVPITISLAQKKIVSIIGKNEKIMKEYMQNLILQLITLQNYRALKLVFFVKDIEDWDYLKMIPHIWDDSNQSRFLASNRNDINQIAQYLEEQINERIPSDEVSIFSRRNASYKEYGTYYLIITDDYRNIHDVKIIDRILNQQENFGFSLLCISDDIRQLPNKCKVFIELDEEKANLYENEESSTIKQEIKIDKFEKFDYSKISRVMSNMPIKYTSSKALTLPEHYNFLEMFKSGNIEQLNIFDRWSSNDSTISLQAQIGIDAFGNPIYLDAHEKYHGPHGLIAGTTGSGKSEFIITYILSLAVNYHPDDVTFVLIDYKGGGLAGAFKKQHIQLPHLVGTITNIDSVGLQRSLESIQSELRRRQIMFNEAKNITNESTIDIYKYQKFYHDGVLKKPISHLFIICDEFAELKQQQPEFMAELMSVSRIGRSLGVHLILATQKPAGIVNEQIRSNSKFGICLKVQSKSDSKDIIKKTDAALLKRAGQFYINVGNDEYFALGQSGYTGVPYIPSDVVKKEQNNSIEFISNIGNVIKKIDPIKKKDDTLKQKSKGDQLTNIVEYLADLANRKNIVEESLWLDPIPEKIYIRDLRKKYNVVVEENVINPIIGEYDNPFNQYQNVLTLNLTKDGNTIVYGSNDSGKELVLMAVLYDVMIAHSSEDVQFYIIDFGSEVLRMFNGAPHVGDIMLSEDSEKILKLLSIVKKELKRRKEKLLEYNGDYNLFLRTSNEKMPMMIIMINDFANFIQVYSKYEDELVKIFKECSKYGIVFIITANIVNDIRSRVLQNFKKRLALQLVSGDYSLIFSKARRKKPSNLYGRGLCTIDDDTVLEFQTARMFKSENMLEPVKAFIKKLKLKNPIIAPSIPVVPDKVNIEDVKDKLVDLSAVPIGIASKNVEPCIYNFEKNIVSVITANYIEKTVEFVSNLIQEINLLNNVDIVLLDQEQLINENKEDFVTTFNAMTERLNENYVNREKNKILYIILGIDKFISQLGTEKERFTSNLNGAKKCENCYFIVIDTVMKIKAHQLDTWYKKYANPSYGIYIGNGFDMQNAISHNLERLAINSKCGDSFGYVVTKNKATLVKLLGLEDKEENDE